MEYAYTLAHKKDGENTMSQRGQGKAVGLALRACAWAERWFPDPFAVAALVLVLVGVAAAAAGAPPLSVARAFGDGFWSLIPFTMQMCFVLIGGYVFADSAPVTAALERLAAWPRSGRGAVALIAAVAVLLSLLHWGLALVGATLLARALARREELQMDYRAAGAAAYVGLGATWALGLSSSAAQLQANPASMTRELLAITGVIPFSETIFLWQSLALTAVLVVVSVAVAWFTAPEPSEAMTAQRLGLDTSRAAAVTTSHSRPADALEQSPLLSLALVALGFGWLWHECNAKGPIGALSNLNSYNFLLLMLGLLLHWRPRRFLDSVVRAVPSTAGILIQFPLYGGVALILTNAAAADGLTLSSRLAGLLAGLSTPGSFPVTVGVYSALLGFLVPSGGGKWLIEAPYVMQAANQLHVHLGWTVQIYNAAEALPNLINPIWMLPVLGILGLRAKDVVGFSVLQLVVHIPIVLFLLWLLGGTLVYHAPVLPGR
jgi:short-chain fatty acids transporter